LKITVKAFGDLKRLLGHETILEIENGLQVEDLITKLSTMTRTFRKGYIGSHKVGSDLTMILNGRTVNTQTTTMPLNDGDIVELIPYSVGG
jgi:molybdopterin converting factor small subunit